MTTTSAQDEADAVRASLSTPCSIATVAALRRLLGLPLDSQNVENGNTRASHAPGKAKAAAKSTASAQKASSRVTVKAKASESPQAIEKTANSDMMLSSREKLSLATDIFNKALKLLSKSLKTCSATNTRQTAMPNQLPSPTGAERKKHVLSPRPLATLHTRALQDITHSPTRVSPARRSSSISTKATNALSATSAATAECARVALAYLRAAGAGKGEACGMSQTQLNQGTLALVGKMVGLGLGDLAVKEMAVVKRRLEGTLVDRANEKVTVATLLDLRVEKKKADWTMEILYLSTVLKVLGAMRKPAALGAAVSLLAFDNKSSLPCLIIRQYRASKDAAKAAAQLESLSRSLLALCPNVSPSSDDEMAGSKSHPDPETAFCLQLLAFQCRGEWWKLANHQGSAAKELWDPFAKCAAAFARRANVQSANRYSQIVAGARDILQLLQDCAVENKDYSVAVLKVLSNAAEQAAKIDEAADWVGSLKQVLEKANSPAASLAACDVKLTALALAQCADAGVPNVEFNICKIQKWFEGGLGGTMADQDALLSDLMTLRKYATRQLLRFTEIGIANPDESERLHQTCCDTLVLCCQYAVRYLGCAPDIGANEQFVARYSEKSLLVTRVARSLLESLSLSTKSGPLGHVVRWEKLDAALRDCSHVIGQLKSWSDGNAETENSRQIDQDEQVARISNIYWNWYLVRRKAADHLTETTCALRRSVDVLRLEGRPLKALANYLFKLERLGRELASAKDLSKASDAYLEVAQELIRNGVLQEAARATSKMPLKDAWAADSQSARLLRVLQELHRVLLKSGNDTHFGQLLANVEDAAEKAVLLELRLSFVADDGGALQEDFDLLADNLLCLYNVASFPLRRIRVACQLLHVSSKWTLTLGQETMDTISSICLKDVDDLAEDAGLANYRSHFLASFNAALAFSSPSPVVLQLKSSIRTWESILDGPNVPSCIDDNESWIRQLQLIVDFSGFKGEGHLFVAALAVLIRALQSFPRQSHQHDGLVDAHCRLALQFLRMGYSGKARVTLEDAKRIMQTLQTPDLWSQTRWHLTDAEYHLVTGDAGKCGESLAQAERLAGQADEAGSKPFAGATQRFHVERLVAMACRTFSIYAMETGCTFTAIRLGKQAVKLHHRIWAAMETLCSSEPESCSSNARTGQHETLITACMSKLSLNSGVPLKTMVPVKSTPRCSLRGPSFWPLVPDLFQSQLHLSEVFAWTGLWQEAVYNAEQALKVADGTGSDSMVSRCYAKLAALHSRSGRLSEAAESLQRAPFARVHGGSLESIDLQRERLNLSLLLGDHDVVKEQHKNLVANLNQIMSSGAISSMERAWSTNSQDLRSDMNKLKISSGPKKTTKSSRNRRVGKTNTGQIALKSAKKNRNVPEECLPLVSLCREIQQIKFGWLIANGDISGLEALLDQVVAARETSRATIQRLFVHYRYHFARFVADISQDLSYNALLESSLSFPSVAPTGRQPNDTCSTANLLASPDGRSRLVTNAPATRARSSRRAKSDSVDFRMSLLAAKDLVLQAQTTALRSGSTWDVQRTSCALTETALLLSAASTPVCSAKSSHPLLSARTHELSGIHAAQLENTSVKVELAKPTAPFVAFPTFSTKQCKEAAMPSPARFQTEYVDALPPNWSAISISHNVAQDELFVIRYQTSQAPFLLRLPLARHCSRDVDEEPFGFEEARAELQQIITESDVTAHSGRDMSVKGAKSEWWTQREALDGRLKDLLQNMENIWFGGFKGIFAQQARRPELLAKLQKSLQNTLDRHLPSRGAKIQSIPLALDTKVLELFTGLGPPRNSICEESTLDEELLDLLYFVVDILHFRGERNAYDEVDFDAMVVDLMTALTAYHEAAPATGPPPLSHTILVLDNNLHAFPWESMPCLAAKSVSRLPSMEALKERLAMLDNQAYEPAEMSRGLCASLSSGTSILNPSGDLSNTESALAPCLDQLLPGWNQYIGPTAGAAVDEKVVVSAIQNSDVFLYFGHGSTAQYARPRAVKKLSTAAGIKSNHGSLSTRATCLLMGCSSAAVTENGEFQPHGMMLSYLAAGAPAVVGCLWDVTDRDCDRFSVECGRRWGMWHTTDEMSDSRKAGKRRKRGKGKSSAIEDVEDARDMSSMKSVRGRKDCLLSDNQSPSLGARGGATLPEAVTASRDACYLRYLNGAAMVVYGIPVYLH